MTYGNLGEKRIAYAACRRCGRVYSTGDHRDCPDCHGRRRLYSAPGPAGLELEEMPLPPGLPKPFSR